MTKQCSRCKQVKDSDCFGNSKNTMDGKRFDCKECRKKAYYDNHDRMLEEKSRDYYQHKTERLKACKERYERNRGQYILKSNEYYKNNKEKILERSRGYRIKNAVLIKQKKHDYYQRPEIKAKNTEKTKQWRCNNPEKRRLIDKRYLDKNPIRKLIKNMRTRIYTVLKRKGAHKTGHLVEQLGCTPEFLKQHLESQFHSYINERGETINMSWDNFGNGPGFWQVDHRIPLFSFDLVKPEEQSKANHYTNLQPLWFHNHNIKSQQDLELKQMFEREGKLLAQNSY